MTQKEAIEVLLPTIYFIFEDIEAHEEFAKEEQGEYQVKSYEDNKRKIESYAIVLGALDPELATPEGLKKKSKEFIKATYGSDFELPEPSDFEKELYEILNPWHKKILEETGYGEDFGLDEEDNKILAKINIEKGRKRVRVDEEEDDAEDPSEDDTFAFYPYRGRIHVVYNYEMDGDLYTYPIEFQEKALEIVKKRMENVHE